MTANSTAQDYLRKHGSYIEALQAMLKDLGAAKAGGNAPREILLCDALDELRVLTGETATNLSWNWPGMPSPKEEEPPNASNEGSTQNLLNE